MTAGEPVSLAAFAVKAAGREGVIWTLEKSEDLNANLVRFATGDGVGEHLNDEVDVLVLGVTGSGILTVDGREHELRPGSLVFVPKGARRSTRSGSDDFGYLTVHRRRGPIPLGGHTKDEDRRRP